MTPAQHAHNLAYALKAAHAQLDACLTFATMPEALRSAVTDAVNMAEHAMTRYAASQQPAPKQPALDLR